MNRPLGRAVDHTGKVFGRLTILNRVESKGGRTTWLAQCACGNRKIIRAYAFLRGTQSCGCLTTEKVIEKSTRHGRWSTKEYQCWADMLARCSNPKHRFYADYGGRGIKVCERWTAFESFAEDMGPRPDGMSIERTDVNGNYEPSNCIWATAERQANNRRGLRTFLVDGEWRTVAQLCRHWGVHKGKAKVLAANYESKIVGEEKMAAPPVCPAAPAASKEGDA